MYNLKKLVIQYILVRLVIQYICLFIFISSWDFSFIFGYFYDSAPVHFQVLAYSEASEPGFDSIDRVTFFCGTIQEKLLPIIQV